MKITRNFLLLLIFSLFIVIGSGCRTHKKVYHKRGMIISTRPSGHIPPGQMKKLTGAKSAKAYAPGQNKSKGGNSHNKGKKGK